MALEPRTRSRDSPTLRSGTVEEAPSGFHTWSGVVGALLMRPPPRARAASPMPRALRRRRGLGPWALPGPWLRAGQ